MTEYAPLPDGFELTRTTPVFDQDTVPTGLLAAHRVDGGVWGRLRVYTGALTFRFEDQPTVSMKLNAGDDLAIPPDRPHRIEVDGPVTFAAEFHALGPFDHVGPILGQAHSRSKPRARAGS